MKIHQVALIALGVSVSGHSVAEAPVMSEKKHYSSYQHRTSSTDNAAYHRSQSSYYQDEKQEGKHRNNYYDDHYVDENDSKRLVLNLVGTGYMYEGEVPDIDGDKNPDMAMCFDVDLQDPTSGESVGYATDCLSEITAESGGVKLIGTTYFYLPDGLIVTRGLTTVQPVLQETVTPNGNVITHITGASSDESGVLKAYGDYAWHQGPVRLSGMVDLSQFTQSVGDPIHFDCLFTLQLNEVKYRWPHRYNWYRHHHYQDDRYDNDGYRQYRKESSSTPNHTWRDPSHYTQPKSY